MKIAVVASEASPFAKTGGLADVAGALPKALYRLGHEPILLMPLYRAVRTSGTMLTEIASLQVPVAAKTVTSRLWHARIPGTEAPAYFIEQDDYFDRGGIYDDANDEAYPDNCERFAFLSRGALEALVALDFPADAVHVHDWPTALVAPYLRILYADQPLFARTGCVLTIHNISHQGVFWHWDMDTLGLDWQYFNVKYLEFWGKINLLKGGIVFADVVNTVSPTYAEEIETPEYGHGLDGVLRDFRETVHGVVNGIDDAVWNPAADPHLVASYGPEDLSGKAKCRRALQRQVKLPQRKAPLIGVVSRFAEQKGLDLAARALPDLFDEHERLQCVVLGDGDGEIEELFEAVEKQYPDRLRLFARYDEHLAHRIIAGSDMLLVPSRFEPCGLTQLYALKYGAVPIVRRTGGLADTVTDAAPGALETGQATGFVFDDPTPAAVRACVERALALYNDPKAWQRLMANGMAQDWSWEASAQAYAALYDEAREVRQRR